MLMLMAMDTAGRRRTAILFASYAALVLIAFLAWITVQFYVGALSVIPILFISYYLQPRAALVTGVITGIVVAVLNADLVPGGNYIVVPPALDILTLTLALAAVVLVARRLRETNVAHEVLQGSLVKARRAADHDSLTGIANRGYFLRTLGEATQHATGTQSAAVLFCDLDGFKAINDTFGHAAGDAVLRMAAARLSNAVRTADTVARLGGDEFGVLVRQLPSAQEVAHLVANIESAFADPFRSGSENYRIGITIGTSICPDDGADPETLLRIADARMYRRKEDKKAARS